MFLVGWFSFRHSFQLVTLPFAAKGFQLCPGGVISISSKQKGRTRRIIIYGKGLWALLAW